MTYNTYGLQTSETDYDFGASTRGAVLRKETWTYPTSGILSLVSTDTVTDGTNRIGLTGYLYDETSGTGHAALVTTSGLPQHGTESGQRGNLTTIQQFPNSGTSYLNTAAAYEDTGNALTVTAPSGVSSYAYDAATHAFTITATPPTPSSGVSLPSSATYDPNSGMPLTSVDPNSQTVTYKSYDPLLRPTEIDYPDGGKMVAGYTYDQTGVFHSMTATTQTNTQTNLDGFGRLNWVWLQNFNWQLLLLESAASGVSGGFGVAPNNGNPNKTYPLLNTQGTLHDCAADAGAAVSQQTGKILSGDWVGTTAAGVLVRAVTVGGLTASGVAQGAAISFAGRALYYGAKGLFNGGTAGAACAISTGTTSLYNSLTGPG